MSERRNDQNHGDNDNQAVLNEIVRNTEMGKNSLDQLIDVTDDRQLKASLLAQQKASLLAQQKEYRRINQQAHAAMAACGAQSQGQSTAAKLMAKMGIWTETLTDRSTRNLADMVIQGANQGVMDCEKARRDHPAASTGALGLLNELQQFEERTARQMRDYL